MWKRYRKNNPTQRQRAARKLKKLTEAASQHRISENSQPHPDRTAIPTVASQPQDEELPSGTTQQPQLMALPIEFPPAPYPADTNRHIHNAGRSPSPLPPWRRVKSECETFSTAPSSLPQSPGAEESQPPHLGISTPRSLHPSLASTRYLGAASISSASPFGASIPAPDADVLPGALPPFATWPTRSERQVYYPRLPPKPQLES